MKKCKECGKLFVPKSARTQYCDDLHYRPCPVCGKLVEAKYLSDPARCCSKECQQALRAKNTPSAAPVVVPGQTELSYKLVDVLRFKTYHRNQKDIMFDMDMEESNGTRKLFQILIRLLDVVKNKKSIMMDEFDMGLHTRLADFILDLIHASESSQLLFTSHNTNLIDVKRLRRDQIVFVNKSEQGATEVYSLYDFKDFRENMDAEKGYIQGRFDAVPYVDSSVSSIKQLLEG